MLRTGHNLLFVERYRLKEHLGTGGFAEVWLASHLEANHTPVVIKIYSSGRKMDTGSVEILHQEYARVQELNHPHLLKPYHFDFADGHPYLVMPYCQYGNLQQQHQKGGLSEREIAMVMYQVGGALAHLHENGIAHQDIKPDNILISAPGQYQLADFGLTTQIKQETISNSGEASLTYPQKKKNQPGHITPHYASPEAFAGKGNTPESDVFSFALMLYELASGSLPFDTPNFTGEALQAGADVPELPETFSDELDAILHACMDLKPGQRLSAAILSHLGEGYLRDGSWAVEIEGEVDEPVMAPPPRPRTRPTRPQPAPSVRKRPQFFWKWAVLLGGSLILLVLAGLTVSNLSQLASPVPSCPPPAGMEGYKGELNENCAPIGIVASANIIYKNKQGQDIAIYAGSLLDGKKDGSGSLKILINEDKRRIDEYYEGNFQNDLMHGSGQYTYSDGSWYIGSFENGKIQGEGRFYDKVENRTITAEWEAGKMAQIYNVAEGEDLLGDL